MTTYGKDIILLVIWRIFLDFPTFKDMFPEIVKTNQDLFALRNDSDDDQDEENNNEETESSEVVVET